MSDLVHIARPHDCSASPIHLAPPAHPLDYGCLDIDPINSQAILHTVRDTSAVVPQREFAERTHIFIIA